jgi:hypothetical protein
MKTCFKCSVEKELDKFYKHPQMADGRVNKCKECNKKDVTENRADKVEHYRAYDRERGNRQAVGYLKEYREKYPAKHKATSMVNNAIRDGKLFREPCSVCGSDENPHAHHDDYAKPLNIRWMCAAHHKQWHVANGEGING